MTDKNYCMSHYLAFRFIKDENINFFENKKHQVYFPKKLESLIPCRDIEEIDLAIKDKIKEFIVPRETALFLSGGIDSAILASYLPEGTKVYTFKCMANNAIDEVPQAKKYAEKWKLDHKTIEIYWDDFEEYTEQICKYQNVPVHSIEIQLYKASLIAKKDGINKIIVGESADLVFGGMDKLLSKDWEFDEFIKRYTFVEPVQVLKYPIDVYNVYEQYKLSKNKIDFLKFLDEIYSIESQTSYLHAFTMANLEYLDPYSYMIMAEPLDLQRIRNGEPKYLLRKLFAKKYPNMEIPRKIPMPRAMDQWLAKWIGPRRQEFVPNCIEGMDGDQKWLIWCLEKFLDTMESQ